MARLSKSLIVGIAALAVSSQAVADESIRLMATPDTTVTMGVWAQSANGSLFEIFRMTPAEGSCLIGPAEFMSQDGRVVFTINAGTHYPAGCGEASK